MDTLLRFGLIAVFLALHPPMSTVLPEELSLLTAGFLSGSGRKPLWMCLATGYFGVVSADTLTWAIGRRFGLHPQGWAARMVGPDRVERIERFYRRWGPWAVVICRQIPGMRTPAFFFAGASGFPLARFLAYEMSAALLTVGLYVTLGHVFAEDFHALTAQVSNLRSVIMGVVFAAGLGALVWTLVRRRQTRRSAEQGGPPDGSAP